MYEQIDSLIWLFIMNLLHKYVEVTFIIRAVIVKYFSFHPGSLGHRNIESVIFVRITTVSSKFISIADIIIATNNCDFCFAYLL